MVTRAKWRMRGELQNRRRSRGGTARELYRRRKNDGENFETVDDGNDGQVQRRSGDSGARSGAKLTGMRTPRAGIEVGAKVELRRQEYHSE
jgi:hypothetical protein